ncbi:tRNA-dihydrouridine synthase 2, partial [Friedmanniomyces endolithicus]
MTAAPKQVPIPRKGVDYRGKVALAPMVRSGECPSRLLALKYGADLVWGPETIDKAVIGTTRHVNATTGTVDFTRFSSNGAKNPSVNADQRESVIYRLHPEREGKRLIYQIGTSNPGMGAALLKTPGLLCSILRALVTEVGEPNEIGISVKIRILETAKETEALVRSLCATGITGLTVHCRTTPMRPRERAIRDQLKMVATVCRESGVACLMNGDVTSRDEALELASEFGCDGAMIATAAETNPSVFRPDSDGGKAPWEEVVQ